MNLSYLNDKFKLSPSKINNGWCFVWALYARQIKPFAQLYSYTGDGCHAFVKINGRFYDAECPQGVNDWKDLPCIKSMKVDDFFFQKQDIYTFCKYWKRNGFGAIPKTFKKYYS